ncbi:MAG: heavy metal sensor histidine kinase [Alphaproteobacteria bacterium]|nr:heavy metal sensor histidine kinase [Alphaproteobacteria bacterium]
MFSSRAPEAAATARPRRTLSIALRMTAWYALSAFALIFVATGLLYWVLVDSMYHEDLRDLADNLTNARLLLSASPSGQFARPLQPRPSWAPSHQPEIYLRVLDSAARTLTETPGLSAQLPPPSAAELAAIQSPQGVSREMSSRSGGPFLTLIVPIAGPRPGEPPQYMEVAMDRAHDEYLLAHYRERLYLVLGVSLVLCSAVGYLIARGGMRPIESISRTTARIRATTLHERIAAEGLPAELRGLAETFNGMLDRLEQSFRHVSQFSDDVAHELRTPINNLRGEIEVALSKARSEDDYRDILGSCLEECARISRVIATLLFLARSDTAADALRRENIDVGEELANVESFYEPAAAEAGVALRIAGAKGVRAELDRTLFQQAIGNLVSNAIAHTPKGGSVELAAAEAAGRLTVTVSDTGCGIAAEHLPRVFERFYRVDRARAGSEQNAGLGLAVVKSIVNRHGGQIEIDSAVGRGTTVKLVLSVSA